MVEKLTLCFLIFNVVKIEKIGCNSVTFESNEKISTDLESSIFVYFAKF